MEAVQQLGIVETREVTICVSQSGMSSDSRPRCHDSLGEMESRDWSGENNGLLLGEPGLDEIIEPVENQPMVRGVQEYK